MTRGNRAQAEHETFQGLAAAARRFAECREKKEKPFSMMGDPEKMESAYRACLEILQEVGHGDAALVISALKAWTLPIADPRRRLEPAWKAYLSARTTHSKGKGKSPAQAPCANTGSEFLPVTGAGAVPETITVTFSVAALSEILGVKIWN